MTAWNRSLWGVELTGADGEKMLIGRVWDHRHDQSKYQPDEPTRALLFMTRKQAAEWCRAKRAVNKVKGWRFTAVRVIETVRREPGWSP